MDTTNNTLTVTNNVTVPPEYICPITLELMVHPLATRHGPNFERSAIIDWLRQGHHVCPLTRRPLCASDMIHNNFLANEIAQWRRDHGLVVHASVDAASSDRDASSPPLDGTDWDAMNQQTLHHIYGTVALPYTTVVPAFGNEPRPKDLSTEKTKSVLRNPLRHVFALKKPTSRAMAA